MNIRKSIEAASSRRPASRKEAEAKTTASLKRKLKSKRTGVEVIEDREAFDADVSNASRMLFSLRVGGGLSLATSQTLGDLTYGQAKAVGTMLGVQPPTVIPASAHVHAHFASVALHGNKTGYVFRVGDPFEDKTAYRGAWLIAIARATGGMI